MLPPLHVPEFRWWDCQNCLQRSAADASQEKNCGGRKATVNTSVDMIDYSGCQIISCYMKEKTADVMSSVKEDIFTSGNLKKGMVREVDQAKPSFCETRDVQCLNKEKFTKNAETLKLNSKGGGLIELGKPNCGVSEVDEVRFRVRNLNVQATVPLKPVERGSLYLEFPN
ncbi:hypothetical protein F0562_022930 [Nyssa sinensis]|uniref:Uncharacterized protein n=1 Tax=Nyssa sinensis TaxID=561372 RepID=A0A5J5BGM8_9ASTE|nr:hypothetical protein F0562_022930 [Nyssa sinensis]